MDFLVHSDHPYEYDAEIEARNSRILRCTAPRHSPAYARRIDSHNAATAAVDAPHGVQNEDEKPPQGNELKAPFGELVVTGCRQMAARADCGRTLARSHSHFDALLVGTEVSILVNKASETVAAVQDRD
jgi:hypothetical protein